MASKSVTLTEVSTGKVIYVSASNILNFYATGADSIVTFVSNTGEIYTGTFDETVGTVNTAAARTQALTLTDSGTTFYLNSDRIIYIEANGSGATITYNGEQQYPVKYDVDETPANINTAAGNTFAISVLAENGGSTNTVYINNLYINSFEAASSTVTLPTLTATYSIKEETVAPSAGGAGYTAATVSFAGGGVGAVLPTATATVNAGAVDAIIISDGGSNITADVTCTIAGDGVGALAVDVIHHILDTLTLATTGAGLDAQPTVSFSAGAVTATATIGIDNTTEVADSVTITNVGSYLASQFPPTITIAGGAGTKLLYNDFKLTALNQLDVATAPATIQSTINAL